MPPLPFQHYADVLDQAGDVIGQTTASVWQLSNSRTTTSGEAIDATGEAHPGSAALLIGEHNRSIVVDGTRYRVVSAILRREGVRHVQLGLVAVSAGG